MDSPATMSAAWRHCKCLMACTTLCCTQSFAAVWIADGCSITNIDAGDASSCRQKCQNRRVYQDFFHKEASMLSKRSGIGASVMRNTSPNAHKIFQYMQYSCATYSPNWVNTAKCRFFLIGKREVTSPKYNGIPDAQKRWSSKRPHKRPR